MPCRSPYLGHIWRLTASLLLVALVSAGLATGRTIGTAGQDLTFDRLSSQSGLFLNYDGEDNFSRDNRDWPVTLVFYRNASVNKVKDALTRHGYTNGGSPEHEAYITSPGGRFRFDSDSGKKQPCNSNGGDAHYRVYAPSDQDRFYDRDNNHGYFVVATTHLDHGESGCRGPRYFGFSETSEKVINQDAGAVPGWQVRPDHMQTKNYERIRRDKRNPGHYWKNDGLATAIAVP